MHNIANQIYQKVSPLPEPLAREVLDFVNFISYRHQDDNLMNAQTPSMQKIWDNPSDEAWNNV